MTQVLLESLHCTPALEIDADVRLRPAPHGLVSVLA